MRTNLGHIYTIGDVTGLLQLAHVAEAQAQVAAETIGGAGTLPLGDYRMLPRATFCQLQVTSFGLSEELVRTAAAKNEIVGAAVVLGAMTTVASVPGPASCANCDPHEVGF
jgi:pyruvate/2-oxoglutarate dehydrogenase complex dihydrolipoamide dehydrogenase (E3) component